jgi:hypothetical protein
VEAHHPGNSCRDDGENRGEVNPDVVGSGAIDPDPPRAKRYTCIKYNGRRADFPNEGDPWEAIDMLRTP